MKVFLFVLMVPILFFSCQKKNDKMGTASSAPVSIYFQNNIGGAPIVKNQYNYTNAAGNLYTVSLLKYYVTNAVLTKDDNTEIVLKNYDLIDAFDPTFSSIEIASLPNGNYKSMRFFLGVDVDSNHTLSHTGDLDAINGMIWSWSTGYIFFKHEGSYIKTMQDTGSLQYHLGTDAALATINIPITLHVEGNAKKLNISFDLNKMYLNPVIDFNDNDVHQSTLPSDSKWISDMNTNSISAFSFVSEE